MLWIVLILAWLLINSWVTFSIIALDEHYSFDEWLGLIIACIFSPLMLLTIQAIIQVFKKK